MTNDIRPSQSFFYVRLRGFLLSSQMKSSFTAYTQRSIRNKQDWLISSSSSSSLSSSSYFSSSSSLSSSLFHLVLKFFFSFRVGLMGAAQEAYTLEAKETISELELVALVYWKQSHKVWRIMMVTARLNSNVGGIRGKA